MPETQKILVQKASGEVQKFSINKLTKFMKRIGVENIDIEKITADVQAEVHEQTSTLEIAQIVTKHILRLENGEMLAARYNLKAAIRKMGPEGHIFEKYISRLFEKDGYKVTTSVFVEGKCARHEVDVVAIADHSSEMVECKFHNREGIRSEITTAMYTYARFLDIQHSASQFGGSNDFSVAWLATNTKLTIDAEKYANCQGMKVLSIELPWGNGILERVIKQNTYPISTIEELTPYLHGLFLDNYILLEDILDIDGEYAQSLGISTELLSTIITKAYSILGAEN